MMSSKAHQASAATLSTDIPHTDSAATLLSSQNVTSSQKSLPPLPLPAAPALPPNCCHLPAVPTHPAFSAFRGNPRPPMIGVGPVMLPPDNYRPPPRLTLAATPRSSFSIMRSASPKATSHWPER